MTIHFNGLTIDWLGYATTRLAGDDTVVYTDPGRYGVLTGEWATDYGGENHPRGDPYRAEDGDIVVVTHDHHYDSDGIDRVASDDATVVVYEAVDTDRIQANSGRSVTPPEDLGYELERVAYGDSLSRAGVDIDVIPAYNKPDGPRADPDGTVSHPHGFGCGFLMTLEQLPCLWPGDTDVIEEHHDLDVSLLLPSIARNFTMNRAEAAELAGALDPGLVLPIHYNTFDALQADSRAFAADVASRSVPVVLDERGTRLRL